MTHPRSLLVLLLLTVLTLAGLKLRAITYRVIQLLYTPCGTLYILLRDGKMICNLEPSDLCGTLSRRLTFSDGLLVERHLLAKPKIGESRTHATRIAKVELVPSI